MFDYSGDPQRSPVQNGLKAAITAIQLDPDLPNAYLALAILNLAMGEHDKALAAARHSIRLNRNFADGYAILAEAGVYGGDLTEALKAIQHAKRLHPLHPESYHWIEGHIRYQIGDAVGARPFLERVVETTPGFIPAFVTQAATYSGLGELERGRSVLKAARALAPDVSVPEYLEAAPYVDDGRRLRMARALEIVRAD
ncbi:tetratricopeptide repeat protein [Tranquillimonas rosea]|uniref:tetratricopeptide repeat protein n=1 Tax=Tranquillimonas rosea TaxID=641238 RepID=UPI003BA86A4D